MALQIKCKDCGKYCTQDYYQIVRKPSGKTIGFYCVDCITLTGLD